MVNDLVMFKKDYSTVGDLYNFEKGKLYRISETLRYTTKVYDEALKYSYWISKSNFYTPKETTIKLRELKIKKLRQLYDERKG